MKSEVWSVTAGRCLNKNGKPLFTMHGCLDYNPCELDQLAHTLAKHLNLEAELINALEGAMSELRPVGNIKKIYHKLLAFETLKTVLDKLKGE